MPATSARSRNTIPIVTPVQFNSLYPAVTMLLVKGQPLGPTESFIGAAITLLAGIYSTVSIFKPSLRGQWGRRGSGGPISVVGCAGWAICAAAWSFCLFCHGIHFQPVDRKPLPILLTAFVLVMLAALGDSLYFGRAKKSTMKSFHVYMKEPKELEQSSKKP